ncbi:MAG: pilus assembly protein TadG-related protein [Jannaschia sp.]
MSKSQLKTFLRNEDGVATVHGIYWLIAMLMVGGVALDAANGYRVKAQMRVATEAASLAAARHLDDLDLAREAAVTIAAMNLPSDLYGTVVAAEDVSFGNYDSSTGLFVLTEDEPTAVKVDGTRSAERNNGLNTLLLGLVGQDDFEINTLSIARAVPRPEPEIPMITREACMDAMFVSSVGYIRTGGGNKVNGDVCFHGAGGIQTGGGDTWKNGVQFSAASLNTITINSVASGSDPVEDMKFARTVEPVILPQMDSLFQEMWNTFRDDADKKYAGPLLPATMNDGNPMTIVKKNTSWWTIQQGDVKPGTIYLVSGGAQFSGNIDTHDVVIMTQGQLGVGGGNGLKFQDVFFFGTQDLNMSGDINWGPPGWCAGTEFNSYLLSKTRVSLGGWGPSSSMNGVVIAAPTVAPGGALKTAGGVYMESVYDMQLGGNMDLKTCDRTLTGYFELPRPTYEEEGEPIIVELPRQARLAR